MKEKRAWLQLAVLAAMAGGLLLSCASAKGTSQDTQDTIDSTFDKIYSAHYSGLILDGAETYTVKTGDYLAAITRSKWGGENGFYFPVIMMASPNAGVDDPDLITPGMELVIPNLQKNLDDPSARQHIKVFLDEIADVYGAKGQINIRNALENLSRTL
jgi:hypothetical protein